MIMLLLYVSALITKQAFATTNFVFVLTDDQDLLLGSMTPMKNTLKLVANNGATFENAYVNSPICCPSRSTILTGKYLHNTQVVNNSISGGCSSQNWQIANEPNSFVAHLHSNNYKTFYAGKYLNQYGSKEAGGLEHVPKGYDWWIGLKGNSKYYNYTLSINGSEEHFSDAYLTDIMNDYATMFLRENSVKTEPFFMFLAPPAAHAPFVPAERHKDSFPKLKVLRNPSFNVSSANKHWLIKSKPRFLPKNATTLDNIRRKRFQTLLSVDEMVANIVEQLRKLNCLENTYFIFTSDNGFHIGQYAMPWDKRLPYETDIHVPFIAMGPGIRQKSVVGFPISAVDIAPTILDLAGVTVPSYMDGISFKNVLMGNQDSSEKRIIYVEYHGEGGGNTVSSDCPQFYDDNVSECTSENWCKCQDSKNNTYSCIILFSRTNKHKYCEFQDDVNFHEVYDLNADPDELNNIAAILPVEERLKYQHLLGKIKQCRGTNCRRLVFPST